MLTLYYAYLKANAFMLITINIVGCVIESLYLIFYMIYATKCSKVFPLLVYSEFEVVKFIYILL